jgi:predicted PurR-regulated permease PerM
VKALQQEVQGMRDDVKQLLELANKSKGGFWMGMTIASFVGGIVTFIGERFVR